MKRFALAVLGLSLGTPVFAAEAVTKTNQPSSVELLRRTLEEQRKNPDKVIRNLDSVPPAEPPAAPATPAPSPAKPAPAVAPAPPVMVAVPTPAPTNYTIPTNFPSWSELEDAYLHRKISAKRFQEALDLLEKHQKITAERKEKVNKMLQEQGITPSASPDPSAQGQKISDVEAKMDELLRLKAQRENAGTNAVSTNAAATAPLTKRERLNALLRQVIEGKINDAEYKEKRQKILAEPD